MCCRTSARRSIRRLTTCSVDSSSACAIAASSSASRCAQNFTPALIPIGGPLRTPGRGRVLLAGDAGGFVNAVTAEGIYYAMVYG